MLSQEVDNLLRKGAIEIIPKFDDQFILTIFVVPKKDGTCRPVINLKFLNEFVQYYCFKQENLNFALDLIQPNDYLTKHHLKDAYFHVKSHKDYKIFLYFSWKGIFWAGFGSFSVYQATTTHFCHFQTKWYSMLFLH